MTRRKRSQADRKTERIVEELCEAAEQLGLQVRFEKGHFRGGHCVVDGEALLVLNRRHVPEVHVAILAESLRGRDVEGLYLRPVTRQALEAAWARQDAVEADVVEEEA